LSQKSEALRRTYVVYRLRWKSLIDLTACIDYKNANGKHWRYWFGKESRVKFYFYSLIKFGKDI
ncbi:MAG: hypothetical protein ACI4LP_05830, partial [Anaerovoracaceae bacterium]